jgi:hypothetical protein
VSIRRHVLETARQRLVEAQADLDALLEEPEPDDVDPPAAAHVGTDLHGALRRALAGARHFGVTLDHTQVDYLSRVALTTEVDVGGTIFDVGSLPDYVRRLEENARSDNQKLKEQSEEIRELKAAVEEAKTKCPICAGAGELPIEEFTSGDVLNRRVMRKCPAPVHSL